MNCTDFELAIQEHLDARQTSLPAELQPHHDACAACRSFYASQLALVSMTKRWTAPAPPAGLIDAVLSELAAEPAAPAPLAVAPSSRRGPVWITACSVAAMAALAFTLLRTPNEVQQPVANIEPAPPPAEAAIVSDALAGLFQGMNVEYAGLPASADAGQSPKPGRTLPGLGDWPASAALLKELPQTEAPAAQRPAEWRRWDRPVSDRVGQAFGFLWDALPRTPPQSS